MDPTSALAPTAASAAPPKSAYRCSLRVCSRLQVWEDYSPEGAALTCTDRNGILLVVGFVGMLIANSLNSNFGIVAPCLLQPETRRGGIEEFVRSVLRRAGLAPREAVPVDGAPGAEMSLVRRTAISRESTWRVHRRSTWGHRVVTTGVVAVPVLAAADDVAVSFTGASKNRTVAFAL